MWWEFWVKTKEKFFFFLVSHEFDGEKIYTELRCWPTVSSPCVRRLCPGQVRGENASRYKHEKLQCLCILLSFSSCIFLLAITPPYTTSGEVNDCAVKAESRLFDLDSKPAFLNKYSVAEERWHVPLMLQITGYVQGQCFSLVPSATMDCKVELTGMIHLWIE